MTSIFNYNDCIEQLNVPLDTKQMLQKAIKVLFFYFDYEKYIYFVFSFENVV